MSSGKLSQIISTKNEEIIETSLIKLPNPLTIDLNESNNALENWIMARKKIIFKQKHYKNNDGKLNQIFYLPKFPRNLNKSLLNNCNQFYLINKF